MAAICGAILYHTWRARNWKIFQRRTVQSTDIVTQIKEETVHRIEMLNSSKRAYRSRGFIHRILCL